MKRIFKFIGLAIAGILGLILVALLIINIRGIPTYQVKEIAFQRSDHPEAVLRGKKLATMLCANCHMNSETRKLSGKRMRDAPPEFGAIYAPNITQDPTYGIGEWTDGELVYLLRTGIKRDGQYAPPYMAKLPLLADKDMDAIISFLRSSDEMVTGAITPDRPSEPSLLTKLLSHVAFKPFEMPTEPIPLPDTTNTVELGRYLAHNLECFSCHSADFKTNNYLEPIQSKGYFAGGNQPLDLEGRIRLTANLTPDPETGIGKWTDDQFIKAVKYGLMDGEPALSYPMTPYLQLTDYEVRSIFDYLMTIPAISNKVDRSVYD